MKEIEELLKQTIGLHTPTIGSSAVQRAILSRMSDLNFSAADDYLRLLRGSLGELRALVENVVVMETWFFRDREPFRALANLVQREWLPANPTRRLKLLSLPCATGEEPYSMAMALLNVGVLETRFQIDALDISAAAIAGAKRAEYGKNSFRGKDLAFRGIYFKAKEKNWALDERVKNCVRLQTGNVFDADCLSQARVYDFIFCRNLLIYFDRAAQERLLRKLDGLLRTGGVLFVGSAELPIAARNGFVSLKLPLSFACRKGRIRTLPPERGIHAASIHEVQTAIEISGTTDVRTLKRHECRAPSNAASAEPAKRLPQPVDLAHARKLADEGKLEETRRICEAYLRAGGVSADAYFLLGLVNDAIGAESQASEYYRKALYLEPNHYETLQQWALLSEKNGDEAHAQILNERAGRLKLNRNENR